MGFESSFFSIFFGALVFKFSSFFFFLSNNSFSLAVGLEEFAISTSFLSSKDFFLLSSTSCLFFFLSSRILFLFSKSSFFWASLSSMSLFIFCSASFFLASLSSIIILLFSSASAFLVFLSSNILFLLSSATLFLFSSSAFLGSSISDLETIDSFSSFFFSLLDSTCF